MVKTYLFLLLLISTIQQNLYVTPDSLIVNANTIYKFDYLFEDNVIIPANAIIRIIFPIQYTSLLAGSPICKANDWPVSAGAFDCSFLNNILTVSNIFAQSTSYNSDDLSFLSFNVSGIKNAGYVIKTSIFQFQIIQSTNNILIINSYSQQGITFQAGSLNCIITTVGHPTVNSNGTLQLSITPSNPIPSNGKLLITTQTKWPSTDKIIFQSSSITCVNITNTQSTIQCEIQTIGSSTPYFNIYVSDLFSIQTVSQFIFSLNPFLSPETLQNQGSFEIRSKTNDNNDIDICSNVKFTGVLTPGNINNLVFDMSQKTVNSLGQANFTFNIINNIKSNDIIRITFPNDFIISDSSQASYLENYLTISSRSSNIINLTNFDSDVTGGVSMSIYISSIQNPASIKSVIGFVVGTYRNGYLIDQSTNILAYSSTIGSLLANINPSNSQAGTLSNYNFILTLGNPITADGRLQITFPSVFLMTNTDFICSSNKSITTECIYNSVTRVIQVTNISQSTVNSNQQINLTIRGITNPSTVGIFPSLTLRTTYKQSADFVDSLLQGVFFSVTARTLNQNDIQINSSNLVVYSIATLTIKINNFSPVQSHSKVFIGIPQEINTQQSQSCQINSNGKACNIQQYNGYNGYFIQDIVPTDLPAGGLRQYSISILGIRMPISTKPTSSFQIYIINPSNQVSQFLTNGLTIAAITPSAFKSLVIESSNNTNYAISTFTITFQPFFAIQSNSIVQITLPSIMTSTNNCIAGNGLTLVTCVNQSNIINVTLQFNQQTTSSSMTMTLNNLRNYPSLAQYLIEILLLETTGNYKSSISTYLLINTYPATISINSQSFNPRIMNEPTSLTFSISPVVPLSSNGFIRITFPSVFTLGSILCNGFPLTVSCSISGLVITLSNTVNFVFPLTGTIQGITSPKQTTSTSIYIESYDSGESLMTRDSSIIFSTACNLFCRTCSESNISECQTCYSDPTLASGNIIINQATKTCNSSCPNGQYAQSLSCKFCPENCTSCVSSTDCTACLVNTYLHNLKCLVNCPNGFYKSPYNQTCVECSSVLNCETCQNSLSCLTCLNPFYFYLNRCLVSCPTNITIPNNVLFTCDVCPNNCTYCYGSPVTICSVCNPGYLLDNGRCFLTCQTLGYVPFELICTNCNSICLTCQITPTRCTSCNTTGTNKYIFNNNCISSCSGKFYNDLNSFTCISCNAPCETCLSASISSCLSCNIGTYLYENTCPEKCPDQFFINGSICSACLQPCLTCSSAFVCTSCRSGLFFYNQNCVQSCPVNMIVVNSNICQNCFANCKTCIGNTQICQSCYPTFYLMGGKCQQSCLSNYYISSTNSCLPCLATCATCTSDTVCVTCITDYYLDGVQCTQTCSANKIPYNNKCTNCDLTCSICQGLPSNCSLCAPGNVYTEEIHKCSLNCPSGYVLYQISNTCHTICPGSYYNLSNLCTPCSSNCLNCVSSNNCTQCIFGLFVYNGLCYSSCPTTAPHLINNQCKSCNIINCKFCSSQQCSLCQTGYLLIKYIQCITSCTDDQIYNSSILQCVVKKNETTQNNTNTDVNKTQSSSINFVPAPVGIAGVTILIILSISKCLHPHSSLLKTFLPILSTLTIASTILNFLIFFFQKQELGLSLLLKIAGLGIYIVLNFSNIIVECIYLKSDKQFQKQFKKYPSNIIILIFSSLITFKWFIFLSSSFCSIPALNLKLQSQKYITALKWMLFSSILALGCFIGGSVINIINTIAYLTFSFFIVVELIVLAAIEIILTFMIISTMNSMLQSIKSKGYEVGSQIQIDSNPNQIFSYQQNTLQKIPLYEDQIKDETHQEINDDLNKNRYNKFRKQDDKQEFHKNNKQKLSTQINKQTNNNKTKVENNKKQSNLQHSERYQQLISQGQLNSHSERNNEKQDSFGFQQNESGNNELTNNKITDLKKEQQTKDDIKSKVINNKVDNQDKNNKDKKQKGNKQANDEVFKLQQQISKQDKAFKKQVQQKIYSPSKRLTNLSQTKQNNGKNNNQKQKQQMNQLNKQNNQNKQGNQLRRTDSCQFPQKPMTASSKDQIRSAFLHPNEVIKLPNKMIPGAIQQGLFNHDLKSIVQNQRKQDQQSALQDAPKMNQSLKRPINQEQMTRLIEKDQQRKLRKKQLQQEKKKIQKQKLNEKQKNKQQPKSRQHKNNQNKIQNKDQDIIFKQDEEQDNFDQSDEYSNKQKNKQNKQINLSDPLSPDTKRIQQQNKQQQMKNISKKVTQQQKPQNYKKQQQIIDRTKSKIKQDKQKSPIKIDKSKQQQLNTQQNKVNKQQNNINQNQINLSQTNQNIQGGQSNKNKHKSLVKPYDNFMKQDNTQSLEKKQPNQYQNMIQNNQNNDKIQSKELNNKQSKNKTRLNSESSRKLTQPVLDPIDQQDDLGATMEKKNKQQQPQKIFDWKFDDQQLEEDPEQILKSKMKTLQPKQQKKKYKKQDDDQLESIATVEQVDIKLPSDKTNYKTLDPSLHLQNRYLPMQEEDLQRPSQYFRQPRKKPHIAEISVSSFGSLRSKQTSNRLNNIGRMSLDNSFQKSKKPPKSQKR